MVEYRFSRSAIWLGVPTLPKIGEGWGIRQEGEIPNSGLKNIVGFEGAGGLFEDLGTGHIPAFSFIAPNQCNDQHGRGNGGPQCDFDPNDNGTQAGLIPR